MLMSRHASGDELLEIVLAQRGKDTSLEGIVVRDDVPHVCNPTEPELYELLQDIVGEFRTHR